jgi:hypothetical protein
LPWEEKDLRRLMEMKRREWREGKEERRRRKYFPNQEREKDKGNEIFSHTKHINIPFHVILPYCPCLKRI